MIPREIFGSALYFYLRPYKTDSVTLEMKTIEVSQLWNIENRYPSLPAKVTTQFCLLVSIFPFYYNNKITSYLLNLNSGVP